ncbi:MAG: hypothetical protein ACE5NW_05425 [Acidiferrobacterales bacterium]
MTNTAIRHSDNDHDRATKFALAVWIGLVGVCLFYLDLTIGDLPERVPNRFDLDGRPVAWFERFFFIVWVLAFFVGLNGLFAGLWMYFKKPRPRTIVNIPWKHYWFGVPEHHAEGVRRVRYIMVLSGIFSNFIWLVGYHLCVQEAGIVTPVRISVNGGVGLILVGTIVFIATILLYMKPRR